MFDLGAWAEFIIIAVAALVLIGPKEMPTVLHAVGRWVGKIKRLSENVRLGLNQYIQEGEFEEYRDHLNKKVMTPPTKRPGRKKKTDA